MSIFQSILSIRLAQTSKAVVIDLLSFILDLQLSNSSGLLAIAMMFAFLGTYRSEWYVICITILTRKEALT